MLQTILKVSIRAGLALVLALLTLQGSGTATADEGENASAFSVVTSEVRLIPVGHDGMRIMGILSGPFFVDAGYGPSDAGDLNCLANMTANHSSGKISGEGSRVIVSGDSQLFADWTCEGVLFVGCKGDFVITGGDGRFEGATGGGVMVSRTSEAATGIAAERAVGVALGRGILFWESFDVALP